MNEDESLILKIMCSAEIGTYTQLYGPDQAVLPISFFTTPLTWTKYRIKKALKGLISIGYVKFTSQGRPAIVSYGEVPELVCEAKPPVNGYTLTESAFKTPIWRKMYAEWEADMAKLAASRE